jgi:UPF0271 protein
MIRIDLNCDMGESIGDRQTGADEAVMPWITSANIACGFHAGDSSVMRRTVAAAIAEGVAVGAHVGLPDREGFGRRVMQLDAQTAYDITVVQVGALQAVARSLGARVGHVKPHGALYHMLDADAALGDAVARAIRDVAPGLRVVGRSGGPWLAQAERLGLAVLHEVFADRAYRPDGTLQPRGEPGASIDSLEAAAAQAVRLACDGRVESVDGQALQLRADTLCIHGDRDDAESVARTIREHLDKAGVEVARASPD